LHKTTVYMDEDHFRALKRLARERGQPEAVLVREALARYLMDAPRPRLRCLGAGSAAPDLAQRTDDLLAQGFGKAPA